MKETFTLNANRDDSRKKIATVGKTQNTKRYGTNTLRSLGPQIWNSFSNHLKNEKNLNIFKELNTTWSGPKCGYDVR